MGEIKVGIIAGTGLAESMPQESLRARHEVETPFGAPSDSIVETEWAGLPVFLLSRHGPGHVLNPSEVPYRANVLALKMLGCTHVIASGAVGSLREELRPRDLVIPDQVIDMTSKRANTFYERAAVHVEFADPFCPVLRRFLIDVSDELHAERAGFKVHARGCYVCMEGPAFSTQAESSMHRSWGGDLIGMTAMPEAKLAREAEMAYAMVALVTDYDCWRQQQPSVVAPDRSALLQEIIGNVRAASENASALVRRAVERIARSQAELQASPARDALKLAVWSQKEQIPHDEVERLRPLWGRHFSLES